MEKKRREDRNRSLSLCVRWASIWGILAVLLAYPSVTHANYFEFELDAADLGDLIRENAEYNSWFSDVFCPQEFGPSAATFFLDDIDFSSGPRPFLRPAPLQYGSEDQYDLPTATGYVTNFHPTQLIVPVILGFKNHDDFYDSATDINDFNFTYDADLVFALTAEEDEICFTYVVAESNVSNIVEYVDEFAEDLFDVGCLPIDITSFGTLLKGLAPAHVGITSDDQGDRLAFRVEYSVDGPPSLDLQNLASWNEFYNYWTSAATLTYDWNMLLHHRLLRANLKERISDAISSSGDTSLNYISTNWTPDGANGGQVGIDLHVTHNSDKPSLIICGPIDADLHVFVDIYEESDNLIIEGIIGYDEIDFNWLCTSLNISSGGALKGFVKLLLAYRINLPFSLDGCATWDDGKQFKCEQPLDLPVLGFSAGTSPAMHLDLDEMRGEADGMVIGGSSDLQNLVFKDRLSSPEFSLGYGMHGSCSTGFTCGYHGKLSLDGSGRICRNGDEDDVQPGVQEGIWVRNDPMDVYGFSNADSVVHLPGIADVAFPLLGGNLSGFWAAPYPFQAHVRSTVGGKTFQTPAPIQPTDQELDDCLEDRMMAWMACQDWQAPLPGFFWPWWLIDPPPDYILDIFLGIHTYPGIEIENQASVLTVNLAPLLIENGQQVQGSFETCSGTVTSPNGVQTDLIFDAPAGVMDLTAQSLSEFPMEAQLRNLALKGIYLVEITCSATIDGSNDYPPFTNMTAFYVDPEALPACSNDDCDGDGIPNEQEDGDADLDGWPDAFDTDFDNDGIDDANDNCLETWNENQSDIDGDGIGDVCDCADPPVIDLSQAASHYEICTPHGARIELEAPLIFDTCTPPDDLYIENYLISSNGVQMDVPLEIPIAGGKIDLPEGLSIILWVATDADGNQSEAEQFVDVVFEPSVACCEDESELYLGGSGFDLFYIDDGPACVASFGGGDVVYMAGLGNDHIWLGGGNDIVHARLGKSVIIADDGHDIVHFACGGIAYGGQGWDYIECYGNGDTEVYGGVGRDIIKTGGGDDLVAPGGGRDQVSTGAGDDEVILYGLCEIEDGMVLDGGEGTDVLYLPEGVTESDLADMNVDVSGFEVFETIGIEKAGFATCN